MEKFDHRERLMLAGLYLSKFDEEALGALGFATFTEAFNVLAAALAARPASINNYRDEFDPVFPNSRRGWHRRPMRQHCKNLLDRFGDLGLAEMTILLKATIRDEGEVDNVPTEHIDDDLEDNSSSFAKRLMTGQAAEQYFRNHYQTIEQFQGAVLQDTTQMGCGFDFKLTTPDSYFGVEVKGLSEPAGSVTFTAKEHAVANRLQDRYFLFVVRNFKELPYHSIHQNPLGNALVFSRVETAIIQVSWRASV